MACLIEETYLPDRLYLWRCRSGAGLPVDSDRPGPICRRMTKVTVWFDGNCPLCTREIALVRRLDRRSAIAFVDLSSVSAECPVDRRDFLARFHAEEDGRLLSGAGAFAAVWRAIPILRPLGLIARHRIILGILEGCYRRFLQVRPGLQSWLRRREASRATAT